MVRLAIETSSGAKSNIYSVKLITNIIQAFASAVKRQKNC
jgi:hypothetical protein